MLFPSPGSFLLVRGNLSGYSKLSYLVFVLQDKSCEILRLIYKTGLRR